MEATEFLSVQADTFICATDCYRWDEVEPWAVTPFKVELQR